MNTINWASKYLIPKLLKDFMSADYNKAKFIKNFIIIAMLRNYTSTNNITKKETNSIIINKNLVTSPIDTTNLTITFNKDTKYENFVERVTFKVYQIVIHINNKFNPTNIGLFETKNNIHFYQLSGDDTLHLNLGLLTFFRILSNDFIKLPSRKFEKGNQFILNSKLSEVVSNLIKTEVVTLYKQDLDKEWTWESEYLLDENKNYDPLKFAYNSELDIYWRFDLINMPIFIYNIWWDVILILFKLYGINIWKTAKQTEGTNNQFRLKTTILQLLGGFNKLNMFEKLIKFFKNHYVVSSERFENIETFEKTLMKLNKCKDVTILNSTLDNMLSKVGDQLTLTKEVTSNLESVVLDELYGPLGNQFYDLENIDFNNFPSSAKIKTKLSKLEKDFQFTQKDETEVKISTKEFISNYQFNVIIIYMLSLESIIILIHNVLGKLKKNITGVGNTPHYEMKNKIILDTLNNILFTVFNSYIKIILFYNEKYLDYNLTNIKLNVPVDVLPLLKSVENNYISFTLLFSEIKIEYNFGLENNQTTKGNFPVLNSRNLINSETKKISEGKKVSVALTTIGNTQH